MRGEDGGPAPPPNSASLDAETSTTGDYQAGQAGNNCGNADVKPLLHTGHPLSVRCAPRPPVTRLAPLRWWVMLRRRKACRPLPALLLGAADRTQAWPRPTKAVVSCPLA